ncbi:CTP synthase [Patescibacteria group bacterium]|nr:CTP synthase [Patescibacteria group bacterium]
MTKYIFVVGGVISGVGKGVASASIGKILQFHGFDVTAIKIDPYVNVDAGTMNPTEHGEVFVLNEGTECDQDMGNYERFLDITLPSSNYMTTGSVYQKVIERERSLHYKGRCVQVIPHITDEIINAIKNASKRNKSDFVMIEVGGTVGDYENVLFLEAARQMKLMMPNDVLFVMVSYLPIPSKIGEMKSKPTQQAVKALNTTGIQADIIIARSRLPLDKKRKEKLAIFCNVSEEAIISAPDVESIYEVPLNFEKDKLSSTIFEKLKIKSKKKDAKKWINLVKNIKEAKKSVKIGVVGKYFGTGDFILADSYISVLEAIKHAAYYHKVKPIIEWIDSEKLEKNRKTIKDLKKYDGIIVPGGFGNRGVEGKIKAIQFCRENKIPYFGLCYGMQLLVVEFARNVCRLKKANTTEIDEKTNYPVIDIMPEQKKNMAEKNYGATMRLGAYPAVLKKKTIAFSAYKDHLISERHRHRFEVNPDFIENLEKGGLIFSGQSPDKRLMEIAELPREKHLFFLGTQFHPEFKSHPLNPHPLFREFIKSAIVKRAKH